ncbi:MAG: MFS transporter [Kluyvera sp.]|uniref:MFS transporter n=1 Tax=Kluyvera sp. TaxID=1538228 RepID=UPI003F3107E8
MRLNRLMPIIVSIAMFMEYIDSTVIMTSLPEIAKYLNANTDDLKVAINAYFIGMGLCLPICGWLVNRFGATFVFKLAILLFMFSSILCSLSESLTTFVAGRFFQGISGALLVPVGKIIMLQSVPKKRYLSSINTLTMSALLGPMIGPALGGYITYNFQWQWIFYLNLPTGVLLFLFAQFFKPNVVNNKSVFDWKGGLYISLGFFITTTSVTLINDSGSLKEMMIFIITGIAFFYLYYAHYCNRLTKGLSVLVNFSHLKVNTFYVSVIGGGIFRIGIAGCWVLTPLILQRDLHLTPETSGYVTCASAVGAMMMKIFSLKIINLFGFKRTLTMSTLLNSLCLVIISILSIGIMNPIEMAFVFFIYGFLSSLHFTSLGSVAYAELSKDQIADATTFISCYQLLMTISGVVLSLLFLDIKFSVGSLGLTTAGSALLYMTSFLLASLLFTFLLKDSAGNTLLHSKK